MRGERTKGESGTGGLRARLYLQLHHLQILQHQVSPGAGRDQLSLGVLCVYPGNIIRQVSIFRIVYQSRLRTSPAHSAPSRTIIGSHKVNELSLVPFVPLDYPR